MPDLLRIGMVGAGRIANIHANALARFLLDDEPKEIYVAAACLVDAKIGELGDYDTAMATIRFKKGALCHIDNSRRAAYGYDQRAEVFGAKGKAYTLDVHNDNSICAGADCYCRPPIQDTSRRYAQAYEEEDRVFVECVKNAKTPPSTGYDGRMAVVMGYAALQSVKENRPVRIAEVK